MSSANLAAALLAEHFEVHEAELRIGGVAVSELAQRFGTPLFAYDAGVMRRSYRRLRDALQGFAAIHYSVKANPAVPVISLFLEEGAGVEIASIGEYRRARAAGARPEQILFAGPGKRRAELEEAVAGGIGEIHVESFEELDRLEAIGAALGRGLAVALRVNPVAAVQGGAMRMGGKPSAFGFDEESLDEVLAALAARPHLDLVGLHLFAGTQVLDAGVLLAQWAHGLALARDVSQRIGRQLSTVDLGGGLGIPYFQGDTALDLAAVAAGVPALARTVPAGTRVVVEPGRFLAGPAGVYVMAVNAIKRSRGQTFVVTDGGMHHHLAASGNLGQVIKRDYPVIAPTRIGQPVAPPVSVVGPLCTPLDTLGRAVALPALEVDGLIAVLQSGAYGPSASPGGFLSHPAPAELLVELGALVA
ncbi:MAG: diaminopimelate decarboxylase [Kaistia sp. SCN 65-12]|jgi:diaminopimelate decarboxylase|nr:MAG: diaminopimelate decarboxylase [Kaistia sp. SCN 65-12]